MTVNHYAGYFQPVNRSQSRKNNHSAISHAMSEQFSVHSRDAKTDDHSNSASFVDAFYNDLLKTRQTRLTEAISVLIQGFRQFDNAPHSRSAEIDEAKVEFLKRCTHDLRSVVDMPYVSHSEHTQCLSSLIGQKRRIHQICQQGRKLLSETLDHPSVATETKEWGAAYGEFAEYLAAVEYLLKCPTHTFKVDVTPVDTASVDRLSSRVQIAVGACFLDSTDKIDFDVASKTFEIDNDRVDASKLNASLDSFLTNVSKLPDTSEPSSQFSSITGTLKTINDHIISLSNSAGSAPSLASKSASQLRAVSIVMKALRTQWTAGDTPDHE